MDENVRTSDESEDMVLFRDKDGKDICTYDPSVPDSLDYCSRSLMKAWSSRRITPGRYMANMKALSHKGYTFSDAETSLVGSIERLLFTSLSLDTTVDRIEDDFASS